MNEWDGATRAQRNLTPVVKDLNSTQLFGNLHAGYSVPLETRKFNICLENQKNLAKNLEYLFYPENPENLLRKSVM